MESEIFKIAAGQGFGYVLFTFLLIYTLKTTGAREKKYQETIDKLSSNLGVIQDVKADVEEIKHHIFK